MKKSINKTIATKISVKVGLLLISGMACMQAPLHALTATIANMTDQEQNVILYQEICLGYLREAPKIKIKSNGYETVPAACKNITALDINGKQYAPLKTDQDSFFLIEPVFNEKGEKTDTIVTVLGASDSIPWMANLARAGRNLDKINNKQFTQLEKNDKPALPFPYKSRFEEYGCYAFRREDKTAIYDLTAHPFNTEGCIIREPQSEGDKSFTIINNTSSTAYVRIAYEAAPCMWRPTGFVLSPGQQGRIFTRSGCIPTKLSGHLFTKDGKTVDIHINDRYGTLGHHRWEIYGSADPSLTRGIKYLGKW